MPRYPDPAETARWEAQKAATRRSEPDLCARCGMIFPPDQACNGCVTDAEKLRAAAAILRDQMKAKGKEPFTGLVFVRVLERHADRLEAR